MLVYKKEPNHTNNALRYFIGYNDNDVIRPLCLTLSQMTGCAKKFNENATICLLKLTISSFEEITIKYGKKLKSY